MKDLFGFEITEEQYLAHGDRAPGPIQRRKAAMKYDPRGGTVAAYCGNCAFAFRRHAKFLKCYHVGCSSSIATDIRVHGLCNLWEPRP